MPHFSSLGYEEAFNSLSEIQKFALHALFCLGPRKAQSNNFLEHIRIDDDLDELLIPESLKDHSIDSIRIFLAEAHGELKSSSVIDRTCKSYRRVKEIGDELGLHNVEVDILFLSFNLSRSGAIDDLVKKIRGDLDLGEACTVIASLTESSIQAVFEALDCDASLQKSGLLVPLGKGMFVSLTRELSDYLQIAKELLPFLCVPMRHRSLLGNFFSRADSPQLSLSNFHHVRSHTKLIKRIILDSVVSSKRGVNILVHGTPGVGKTQFCIALASELGLTAHFLNTLDQDGDPLPPSGRVRLCQLGQFVLDKKQGAEILLVDEAEDIFSNMPNHEFSNPMGGSKGRINRLLETNPVPTIWVTNQKRTFDEAFQQRFTYVLDMPNLSYSQRFRLIEHQAKDLFLSKRFIHSLARQEALYPRMLTNALEVARVAKCRGVEAERAISLKIDPQNRMFLMVPNRKISRAKKQRLMPFNPVWINASEDVQLLAKTLEPNVGTRLLLHGRPGTGKTAFAHYLARQLRLRVISIQASDILGMFVGENESNIARAFDEARQPSVALLIDEIDGLIANRSEREPRWESRIVNQFLHEMDELDSGLLMATSNRFGLIDPAAMRRFDMKIRFEYLHIDSSFAMSKRLLRRMGCTLSCDDEKRLLGELKGLKLVCSDFATIERRSIIISQSINFDEFIRLITEAGSSGKEGQPDNVVQLCP